MEINDLVLRTATQATQETTVSILVIMEINDLVLNSAIICSFCFLVSILVIMEINDLVSNVVSQICLYECFNPCYNGN